MTDCKNRLLLIGCGILEKEIKWIIKENNWQLDTLFFDPSIHGDFNKLHRILTFAIDIHLPKDMIVFYGACHPQMDKILNDAHIIRAKGQNCMEMLLGHDLFTKELSNGAYFLIENWAIQWPHIVSINFGNNMEIARQIFHEDRKYLLGLKTPCSCDFTKEAESAAQSVDLPLQWMSVELDNLKLVLLSTIEQKNNR